MRRSLRRSAALAVVCVLGAGACGSDDSPTAAQVIAERETLSAYAGLASEQYGEALAGAKQLQSSVDAFLADPTDATLQAAQAAWKASRPAYLRTEVFRFYDGPIDNAENGREGAINAWPMDEAYIDYVEGNPGAGIINDPGAFPDVTAEILDDQNEKGGEKNISTGYHAVEFLLWGQDQDAAGAGKRPATDYVVGVGTNAERRRAYLAAVTALLVTDLQGVVDAWAPSSGAYATEFVALDPDEGLRRILTGFGTLAGHEVGGERLGVVYETKDQEDEHSCFSDNTTVDHAEDVKGLEQVAAVLVPMVATFDPALATRLESDTAAAVAATDAIPGPFDQAILGEDTSPGRQAVKAAMDSLEVLTATVVEVADELSVKVNTTA